MHATRNICFIQISRFFIRYLNLSQLQLATGSLVGLINNKPHETESADRLVHVEMEDAEKKEEYVKKEKKKRNESEKNTGHRKY